MSMKRISTKQRRRNQVTATLSAATALDVIVGLSQFATAVDYQRAARRDELSGYPLTAAYELRRAAELLDVEPSMADRCWANWERLTGLPRNYAHPIVSKPLVTAA